MISLDSVLTRRGLLQGGLALGTAAFFTSTSGAFAEELARTPRLTEGPFYPPRLPLDTDNDLIIINKSITPAVGEITHLSGRVLSLAGEPINNAVVEIWQCDNNGVYLAQGTRGGRSDKNFQGFGTLHHGDQGRISLPDHQAGPVPRPHAAHSRQGQEGREGIADHADLRQRPSRRTSETVSSASIRDSFERELVLVDFKPIKESKIGELSARFDIVVGLTPDDSRRRRRG